MSSYYPEGSMYGSGIYSSSYSGNFTCSACEKDFDDLEGQTDDWGLMAYADCPDCGAELEKEIE